jgi:hypothetical protein
MKTLILFSLFCIACSECPVNVTKNWTNNNTNYTVYNLFTNWVEVPNNSYGAGRQLVHGWFGMDRDSVVYAEFGTWYYQLYIFDRIDKMVVRNNCITRDRWRIEFISQNEVMFNHWRLRK